MPHNWWWIMETLDCPWKVRKEDVGSSMLLKHSPVHSSSGCIMRQSGQREISSHQEHQRAHSHVQWRVWFSHVCSATKTDGNPQRVKSAVEQIKKSAADPKLPIHGITADFSSLDEVWL
eukprot:scaffold297863_cov18-Tisochrysis_lutea.AAC.1